MTLFPFAPLLAPIASAVLLATLWSLGELTPRALVLLVCWFLIGGYCQFLGASTAVTLGGLLVQTMLAVYLAVRWRVGV